jgi:hypothetical protein
MENEDQVRQSIVMLAHLAATDKLGASGGARLDASSSEEHLHLNH